MEHAFECAVFVFVFGVFGVLSVRYDLAPQNDSHTHHTFGFDRGEFEFT